MKKEQIYIALKTLGQNSQRHKLLKNIETHNGEESEEKLNIFGFITGKQKENVRVLLTSKNPQNKLNPETLRETKKIVTKILRVISSVNNDGFNIGYVNIEKEINQIMKTGGNALEFFILSSLIENKIGNYTFEKGPIELEGNKIDFIQKMGNLRFGVQLTTTNSKNIGRKKEDMQNLQYTIDNNGDLPKIKIGNNKITNSTKTKLTKRNFSTNYLPDIAVLLVINSEISKEINLNNDLLYKSYEEWKKNKFNSRNPNNYLPKKIKKEIDFISKSYNLIINEFLNIFEENKNILKKPKNYKFDLGNLGEATVSINPETKTINFICFPKENKSNEAIYNIEFYLTEKFFKKGKK